MWTRELFGMEIIQMMECFILYSFIGWIIESVYMSFCLKRLQNRGFTYGPFCPIYGFGGVLGYILMSPLKQHVVLLYLTGVCLATSFEFLVGLLMQRFLHEVWWDYNEKPFNYKGIICLESSVVWGFYAIGIVRFVNDDMLRFVSKVPLQIGKWLVGIIAVVYFVDFFYHLFKAMGHEVKTPKEQVEKVRDAWRERLG